MHQHAEAAATVLRGEYRPELVLLSLVIAVFSATMALKSAQISRYAETVLYRHVATASGALALAGGIWTMHFIGMLAYVVPAEVHYDVSLTLASFLPACAASWPALRLLARPEVSRKALLGSGLLVGLGIGTMHYSGMTAMEMSLAMTYDPVIFGLSIVVAAALATLALWIRYGLRGTALSPRQRFAVSGLVMGLAIAGMHYTGMSAMRVSGTPIAPSQSFPVTTEVASLLLAGFTIIGTLLVYATNDLIRSRELYRRVEESESRLRATLETAVDGIITIDDRSRIVSVNQSVERMFGWSADALRLQNITMLLPDCGNACATRLGDGVPPHDDTERVGQSREVMGLRRDGTYIPLRLAVGRMDLPGERLYVGFVTDISERHALDGSLRETAERAERAAAAKSTFLANMSHEIRTPMNSIIGFTELLLQGELSRTQRAHLRTIRQSSRSLLALISDILDTTRLEKDGLQLESIDFSLKGLAAQIESSLRLGAQHKGLSLVTHYASDLPEYFRGDPLRLLQVLTNLVGNAIKFTERGGVTVRFARGAVDGADGVVVAVEDSGIGMSPEQVATIFAPFTQADASISRRFGGTGLGTTISRQLVELMGGSIEVTSTAGVGSCFTVRIPLLEGVAPETSPAAIGGPALPPLVILAADDVAQNLELLDAVLTRDGHQVVRVPDGAHALQRFQAESFDLVLMDVHMPGMDGLETTRLIRQYERGTERKATPIIALTASVLDEDRRAVLQAGMDGFAVKPIDVRALREEMARVLALGDGVQPLDVLPVQGVGAPVIDWDTAISLWGTRERVVRAIATFMESVPMQHGVLWNVAATTEVAAVVTALHTVRGAAGNLGLAQLARTASNLEEQWRELLTAADGPSMRALHRAMDAVEAEIPMLSGTERARTEEGELASSPLAPDTGALGVAHSDAELAQLADRLRVLLQRGELDDDLLDRVCVAFAARGARSAATRLRDAVDGFDFPRAVQGLDACLAEGVAAAATADATASATTSAMASVS